MDEETKQFLVQQLSEFRQESSDFREEVKEEFSKVREEIYSVRQEITGVREDVGRQIGVLAKQQADDMQALTEQYKDIKEILDEHGRILAANQELLLDHDEQLRDIKQSLKQTETVR